MKFQIRPWQVEDIPALVNHANNPHIARFMTDAFPSPYTKAAAVSFVQMAQSHHPVRLFTIEVEGEAAGGIGLHPQNDIMRLNAELGYWLSENYWGKGIMTWAVGEMVKYGFQNFEFDRIYARPFSNNPASQKVLENSGFQLEATLKGTIIKNDERLDELIYAIRRK